MNVMVTKRRARAGEDLLSSELIVNGNAGVVRKRVRERLESSVYAAELQKMDRVVAATGGGAEKSGEESE